MPTYSYACTSCDHRFDVQQAFTDEPLTECPECTARLRKLFGSVGVVFKGSGFYRTDARADRRGRNGPGRKGTTTSDGKTDSAAVASPGTSPSPAGASGGAGSNGSGSSGSGSNGVPAAAPATAGTRAATD